MRIGHMGGGRSARLSVQPAMLMSLEGELEWQGEKAEPCIGKGAISVA